MDRLANTPNARPGRRAVALATVCGLLLVLPSCGIPALRKPKRAPDLPGDFNGASSPDNTSKVCIEDFFADPMLTGLMHQAMVGNQELRILGEEIQIASNEIMARQGAYIPFVMMGGGIGMDRPSRYTREGVVDNTLDLLPGKPFLNPLPNYSLGPILFWTPDIWRQLHNARDAATMRYYSTGEGRSFLATRLIAEIAENYYMLLSLDKQLEILDSIIALQEQSLQVARALMDAARGTELGVQRFQAEVRKNQSEKLIVKQQIIEVENRINFLVGRFPQVVERRSGDFIELRLHELSVGVPAEILRNRPDVRQAERELAATGLDVKVAWARFLPVLTITAGVGYAAFNPAYIFTSPQALVATLAGNMVGPLINKKAIRADYLTSNARQLEAVYHYQQVIINAVTEVVNRLNKVENYRNSIEIKKREVLALEASVDSATRLFQNARAEYIDVLFAQRDLLNARRILIDTKKEQLTAVVDTYQALGGGGYLFPVIMPEPLVTPHRWKDFFWYSRERRKAVPPTPPPAGATAAAGIPGVLPPIGEREPAATGPAPPPSDLPSAPGRMPADANTGPAPPGTKPVDPYLGPREKVKPPDPLAVPTPPDRGDGLPDPLPSINPPPGAPTSATGGDLKPK
ncbi:TolC family protein [Aquisphaera insulae]|uniref:TolC family protein n=1 Tax=Aquisphaera insulae TaxID=2712864 RepID=UPI0013ECE98E|nr:TolC family protein [Aquisphaera insulae]